MAAPGDFIDALVCGLAMPKRQRRIMVMLGAYIDDAGSEPSGPVFFYAGFLAAAEQWKRFSNEWAALSEREPKTPDFHMMRAIRLRVRTHNQ